MTTLSDEKAARARFAGWQAARRLLQDPGWCAWLGVPQAPSQAVAPERVAPLSLRVEALTVRFDDDDTAVAAAGLMARGLMQVLSQRASLPADALDGRLFAVGANRWFVLRDGALVPSEGEIGELRSVGAVLLVVGDQAGDTLNATGAALESRLPEAPGELYLACVGPCEEQRALELSRKVEHVAKELAVGFEGIVGICSTDELPTWFYADPEGCCDALCRILGLTPTEASGPTVAVSRMTFKAITALLRGSTPTQGRGPKPQSAAQLDNWLTGKGWQHINDSALEELFEHRSGWSDKADERDFFARERVEAYAAHSDVHHGGRRNFADAAPIPHLGSKRPAALVSPGLPVLDALWAVRAVQEFLPGRVSSAGPLTVEEVALVCREATPTSEDDAGRKPEQDAQHHCVLYRGGRLAAGDLRRFGLRMLALVESEARLTQTACQFFVCMRLRNAAGEVVTLPVAFPWRFEKRAVRVWPDQDVRCFEEIAHRFIARDLLPSARSEEARTSLQQGRDALLALQQAWDTYRSATEADGFDEAAGLSTGEATWPPAAELVVRYRAVLEAFVDIFAKVGDLAPRVASGALDSFLAFGVQPVGESAERVRVLGYHPIRLARLEALEHAALAELASVLGDAGTLRDVPLTSVPRLEGGPAVLWWSHAQSTDHGAPSFLVPSGRGDRGRGPWSEEYEAFAHPSSREPDLIQPLYPVLASLCGSLFPGMSRRLRAWLHGASRTDRGVRPLLLFADAVQRTGSWQVAAGVDLRLDPQSSVLALDRLDDIGADTDLEDLQKVARAMATAQTDDPRFPLELSVASGDAAANEHLCLLVRPWSHRAEWVVREPPSDERDGAAMTWDPTTRSWNQLMLGRMGGRAGDELSVRVLEQRFQQLVVRRWRREADTMRRCLGLSLETDAEHELGGEMQRVHAEAARGAARVLVVDHVFGAELLDAQPSAGDVPLRVTYADYDRATGWRISMLCRDDQDVHPTREREVLAAGLARLYGQELPPGLAGQVYDATHRAMPSVCRYLWRLADTRDGAPPREAELIGHLGVALFASSSRGQCTAPWPDDPRIGPWRDAMPSGTILLSMDSLQRWTWTRRGGTRGDFIAVVPAGDTVWLLAIESKGSASGELYDGRHQAAVAARKLEHRFTGRERWQERRELMRCLAEEAFRATANHRLAHDLIAAVDTGSVTLRVGAVCVSTCFDAGATPLEVLAETVGDRPVLWITTRGLPGLEALIGR